jgi:GNAT superfamily N-acetyltransferase
LIRKCDEEDGTSILRVINDAANAYRGIIPEDCYHEPYMSNEELRSEMSLMTFYGYDVERSLLGVTGCQPVRDVTLVRHLYVLPKHQRRGIGGELLMRIVSMASTRRILVGTWAAAEWAIRFYEKHGFNLQSNKSELLRKYWKIPKRQIELSVVLMMDRSE